MSTKMTEVNWGECTGSIPCIAAEARSQGPRLPTVPGALHHISVHSITWWALPDRFGKWYNLWKRFDRLSKVCVFETFFDDFAALSSSAHLVQMFDSTVVCDMSRRQEQKGADWPGTARLDRRQGLRRQDNRKAARTATSFQSSPTGDEKNKPAFFAEALYKGRARIEQAASSSASNALPYVARKPNFASIVALVAGFIPIKSVRTAKFNRMPTSLHGDRNLLSDQIKNFFEIEAPSVYFGSTMLPSRTRPTCVRSMYASSSSKP